MTQRFTSPPTSDPSFGEPPILEGHPPGATPPQRRRRRLSVGTAAVGVIAVAALVAPQLGTGSSDAAAAAAARKPALGPGEFRYVRETRAANPASSAPAARREWWIAADGSGRFRESGGRLLRGESPLSSLDAPWRRVGDGRWARDVRFGPGGFSRVDAAVNPRVFPALRIAALPATPDQLERALRRMLDEYARDDDPESGFDPKSGTPLSHQMFVVIGQALTHPLASAAQRAALVRVATRLDGVKVDSDVRDPAGRPATRVVLPQPDITMEFFVSPAASAVLATRIAWPGGSEDLRTYTPPVIVDSIDDRRTRVSRSS